MGWIVASLVEEHSDDRLASDNSRYWVAGSGMCLLLSDIWVDDDAGVAAARESCLFDESISSAFGNSDDPLTGIMYGL